MEGNFSESGILLETHSALGSSTGSFLIFSVFLLALLQVYKGIVEREKEKKQNGDMKPKRFLGVDKIPGPPSYDPTGLVGPMLTLLPLSKTFEIGMTWSVKYGALVKMTALCQNWVGLNSAPVAQALLKSSDIGHLTKSPTIYDLMKPFITNGVLVSKGEFWQHRRKLLMKSQSYQSLKAYMPMLNKHCSKFVDSLEDIFMDGKPHQVNELINSSFIKVISEMITGYDNDQSNEYHEYHQHFQVWKESQIEQLMHPWLLLKPIWKLHPLSRKYDKAIEEMFQFARRRIIEHKQIRDDLKEQSGNELLPVRKFRCILDDLLDAGLDERDIIDEVNTMMLGGHETGAGTIHFFFFCMALNQEFQRECQREVDELFEDPSNFKDDNLTYDAVTSNLKYLERCILETLRLFPPVFLYLRKLESPLQLSCKEQEYLLPAGTNCAIIPYYMHRNEEYFPEPEKFDPDRFLPEEVAKRHPYSFIPFAGGGPRNCLGLKFAMIEMKIILAYTLRHFSITTTDRMEDIPLMPYLTLTPARDYTFEFTKRDR